MFDYDENIRNSLTVPDHYDRMIALIMQHNDACTGVDWAADCINVCVRMVQRGEQSASTGMCMAERDEEGISLHLQMAPIGDSCVRRGTTIRDNELAARPFR